MAEGRVKGTKKMRSGVRSPTAHRTLEQAHKQQNGYEDQPHRHKQRAILRKLRTAKGLSVGDGKEVSHKKAKSKGGSDAPSNITVKSRKANRRQGTKTHQGTKSR